MTNRLGQATSPYLLQHKDNPVDWWEWSEEAFAEARATDRPVLLSVGYAACHWCHVMAHESFEDPDTATYMNEHFVNVKVDREERPDVDDVYMTSLHVIGLNGGWPMSVFLTPDAKPIFGGTYFPPADRYGRPSFRRVLVALSEAWGRDRQGIVDQAGKYLDGLRQISAQELVPGKAEPSDGLLERAIARLGDRVDRTHGGFGGAPKFPNPSALRLLLRGARRARVAGRAPAPLLRDVARRGDRPRRVGPRAELLLHRRRARGGRDRVRPHGDHQGRDPGRAVAARRDQLLRRAEPARRLGRLARPDRPHPADQNGV